ncbi:MAG: flippase-like domain-containing protein [Candidatus Omnitrophica bacterium]|nr:flippase-like domain-containing protein [Candidatus Omnitrophota bacterium]
MSDQKSKTVLSFILRFGLSGILLWYLFSKIDLKATIEVLKSADVLWLSAAGFVFLICNFIILFRWWILIRALDLSVSLANVIRYYFIGLFGNLFLPSAIGGDIIKIIGLCKDSSEKPKVVASVLLDRLSGFASIVIVSVLAFVFGRRLIGDNSLVIPIIILALGSFMVAGILFNERLYEFGCRVFNGLPKFKKALMDMHYDVMLLSNRKKEGFKAIGLSCLSQAFFATSYFCVAKALHQDVAFVYFLIFVPLICVAAAVPSIGGLGVREMGAAYLFAKAGMESGIGASLGLVNFIFMVIVGLIGGLVYVFTFSSGRVQRDSSDTVIARQKS